MINGILCSYCNANHCYDNTNFIDNIFTDEFFYINTQIYFRCFLVRWGYFDCGEYNRRWHLHVFFKVFIVLFGYRFCIDVFFLSTVLHNIGSGFHTLKMTNFITQLLQFIGKRFMLFLKTFHFSRKAMQFTVFFCHHTPFLYLNEYLSEIMIIFFYLFSISIPMPRSLTERINCHVALFVGGFFHGWACKSKL